MKHREPGTDEPATADLLEKVAKLTELAETLASESLPIADIADGGRWFYQYSSDGKTAGYGGFELYGEDALLRSIVVVPSERGRGVGRAIVSRLLDRVRDGGGIRAYLITTTASGYFTKQGFTPIDRAEAPPTILATQEASAICPATAPLLFKTV